MEIDIGDIVYAFGWIVCGFILGYAFGFGVAEKIDK